MIRNKKPNFGKFWVILVIGALIFAELVCYPSAKTKGVEIQQIKIMPTNYSGDPPTGPPIGEAGEAGWQNPSAGLVQDLGPEAIFEEFNQENSAYLIEKQEPIEETPASPSVPLESLLSLVGDEETATESEEIIEEPVIEEPTEEPPSEIPAPIIEPLSNITEKILEFSDFNVPEEFSKENKEIRNVQLGLSLAFQNGTPLDNNYLTGEPDQDSLIIEYQYNSASESFGGVNWYLLAEYRLNNSNSNATNNGYWFFPLPIFDNWQNLEGLKIKFIQRGTEGEIYLDALWLEIGYEEIYKTEQLEEQKKKEQKKEQLQEEIQVQLIALKQNFKVNEDPEFVLPRIESQDLFATITDIVSPGIRIKQTRLVGPGRKEFVHEASLIQEGEDYKVRIKNSSDFPPGQYSLELKFAEFGQIYKTKTQFTLVPLKKFFEFSATKETIETTKKLEWYPERFKPEADNNNAGINIDISSAIDSEGDEQPKLIFQGACQKEYFVILMFPGPDDYIKDPGKFIYNKAFPCQNGAYAYTLDDLPEGLAEGTYYFLVAEQGLTGPWQPITAIQPIEIRVAYK
jgi:flagellar motor protein MotB